VTSALVPLTGRRCRVPVRRAAVIVAAAVLASCGASPAPTAIVLRVATTADEYVTTKDASRLGMYPLNANVAEPLVRLRPDYQVEPALAERWELRPPNTWRFHLRAGVLFHDGRPLTAEAVRWSFGRVARSDTGTSFMTEASTVIVDERTVDVTPSVPNLRLVEQLVHPTYNIVAPGTEPGEHVVGTGPFRVVEYRRGEFIRVERFDGYWGRRPALDAVQFRFFPEPTGRLLALLSNEVDLVTDVPREQATAVAARPGITLTRTPLGQILLLYLNRHGSAPYGVFADTAVRMAFATAIDRVALVRDVWKGEGVEVQSMAPPAVLGRSAPLVTGVRTSIRRAEALLDDAGWARGPDGVRERRGRRLTVTILARREVSMGTGEFLQAQLGRVGMEVTVVEVPDAASYQVRLRAGEFDAALEPPNQNDANPVFLPALRLSGRSSNRTSRWFLLDPPFEETVTKALESETTEEAQRWAAEAMHQAIDVQATVVPLAGLRRIFAAHEHVAGFEPHPSFTSQSWAGIRLTRSPAP
jgi:peptide/nickel transport system substrate-binding protein